MRELVILVSGGLMGASFAIQASNDWQSPLGTALSLSVVGVTLPYVVFTIARRHRAAQGH